MVEVESEGNGLFSIISWRTGDKFGQAGMCQMACGVAGTEAVAGKGHDGDPHPESFAGGQAAGVRKSVQSDVDVAVVGEEFGMFSAREEVHLVGKDSLI